MWLSIPRAVLCTGLCLKQIQSGAPPPRIPRELDIMSNTHDQVLHGNRYSYLSTTGNVSNIWTFLLTQLYWRNRPCTFTISKFHGRFMNLWQLMNFIILNLIKNIFLNIIVIMSAFATPLEDPLELQHVNILE